MKTVWKIIILMLLISNMVVIFCSGGETEHFYPRAVLVYQINEETDVVTFIDGGGFLWEFDGIEDWMIGDVASMLMSDSGTCEYVPDDQVLGIWYGFNIFE